MVALYKPQIPPNTGNIARLCVGLSMRLAIVGKASFELSDAAAKRAGLDHWSDLDLETFPQYKEFHRQYTGRRVVAFSKKSSVLLWDFDFHSDDILLFGNETYGLPPTLLRNLPSVKIPMSGPVRSLNLSNAVAVGAYEFLRRNGTFTNEKRL